MLSSAEMRKAWKAYEAAPEKMVPTSFGDVSRPVAPETVDAWRALNSVISAHGYKVRAGDTGTYSDRDIAGTKLKSLHAYGVALDLNWNTNPVVNNPKQPVRFSSKATQADRAQDVRDGIADTDMTRQMVDDILAIRTNDGQRIFDWGGGWKSKIDTMHFEIDVAPTDLEAGVNSSTVRTEGMASTVPLAAESTEPGVSWSDAFITAHQSIEKWEGGFSNDPDDPGGATNYGITQKALAAWRGHPVTVDDVRNLSRDEARRIFYARYWQPMRLDDMPFPAALMTYNCGVNSGPGRGSVFLQRALNRQGANLAEDGDIGSMTVAAASSANQATLVRDYSAIYEQFYRGLSTWWKFGKGWMNRLRDVTNAALAAAGAEALVVAEPALAPQQPAGPGPGAKQPTIPSPTITETKGEPEMTAIDVALGGKYLLGKKTLIAGAAFAGLTVLYKSGLLNFGGDCTDTAADACKAAKASADNIYNTLTSLIATYGGLSAISKLERSAKE
jgi:lysozyme family protein